MRKMPNLFVIKSAAGGAFGAALFASAFGLLGCFLLLWQPAKAKAGFLAGLRLCGVSLLPSMLPFLILASFFLRLLLDSGAAQRGRLRLLRLPGCCLPVVVFSLVGGFPVGLTLTKTLLDERRITPPQARRMACFCVCQGPAFVMNAVGSDLLKSQRSGVLLYVSLVSAALLVGVLTARFAAKEPQPMEPVAAKKSAPAPIGVLLSAAVNESTTVMLRICAWVCFVSALLKLTDTPVLPETVRTVLVCFTEVTNGCARMGSRVPLPLLAAALGWGGLCAQLQLMGPLAAFRMPLWRFVLFRALNAALCAVLCAGLLRLFPVPQNVMLRFSDAPPAASHSASFAVCACVLAMCLLLLLGNESFIRISNQPDDPLWR